MINLNPEARDLILRFECGDQLGHDSNPEWPGGFSGITIGIGDDLGYRTETSFRADWGKFLATGDVERLAVCCGVVGETARDKLPNVKSIVIGWNEAVEVFDNSIMPATMDSVLKSFPGSDDLPSLCFGAMVALVYNRGPGILGPSRIEMKTIRSLIPNKQYWNKIPILFGSMIQTMKSSWGSPTDSNVSGRRLFEAALFAKGLRNALMIPTSTLLLGDSGSIVANMQKKLQAAGSHISADGEFGPQTMIAVYRRQITLGKPASGVYTGDF